LLNKDYKRIPTRNCELLIGPTVSLVINTQKVQYVYRVALTPKPNPAVRRSVQARHVCWFCYPVILFVFGSWTRTRRFLLAHLTLRERRKQVPGVSRCWSCCY